MAKRKFLDRIEEVAGSKDRIKGRERVREGIGTRVILWHIGLSLQRVDVGRKLPRQYSVVTPSSAVTTQEWKAHISLTRETRAP